MLDGENLEQEQVEINKYLEKIKKVTQKFPDSQENFDDLEIFSVSQVYYIIEKLLKSAHSVKVVQAVFDSLTKDTIADRLLKKASLLKGFLETQLLETASKNQNV